MLVFFLITYSENGIRYDTYQKKVLEKVTLQSLPPFQIPASVEEIVAGTTTDSAFYECRNDMQSITFGANSQLKTIGMYAFSSTSITSIDMSTCVVLETLNNSVFRNCNKLTQIILPNNLKYMRTGAIHITQITRLILPDSLTTIDGWDPTHGSSIGGNSLLTECVFGPNSALTTIGSHAFMGSALTKFNLPKNVQSIGSGPWLSTKIVSFTADPENPYYMADGSTLYSKNGKQLVAIAQGLTDPYTINPNVESLGYQAFRGARFSEIIFTKPATISSFCFSETLIKKMVIPEGITNIADYTFSGSSVEQITLPQSLSSISNFGFASAFKLKNLTLPSTLTSIGSNAFQACGTLRYIEIPMSVTNFGGSVFSVCSEDLVVKFLNAEKFKTVNNLVIMDNNKVVGYFGKDANTDLVFPSFCTVIDETMFKGKKLRSVRFENPPSLVMYKEAFRGSKIQTIEFPSSLSYLGDSCFVECTLLTQISFSGTKVTSIPFNCFNSCSSLTKATFTNSLVTSIGSYSFGNTPKLTVDFESSIIATIESYAFINSGLLSVTFPNTIKSIDIWAFASTSIKSLTFPLTAQIVKLPKYGFAYCNSLSNIVISDLTEIIDSYCFTGCKSLLTFKLGKATTTLETYSFSGCTSMKSITIPKDSAFKRIYPFALEGCSLLSTFNIEDTDKFCFQDGCLLNAQKTSIIYFLPTSELLVYVVPGKVVEILEHSFQSCVHLQELIIPEGDIQVIGYQAFKDCTSLRRLMLPKSLQIIQNEAFDGCNRLVCGCVVVPDTLVSAAISSGISSSLLSPVCLASKCRIYFDRPTCGQNLHKSKKISPVYSIMLALSVASQNV